MIKQPPIALIIFSNDLDSYLSNIETERKIIEEALEHYHDTDRLKVITRSSVSINELFKLFNRYKGRIALFHFAGHASGMGLQLNDTVFNQETGRAEGLADLFSREVTNGQLQLVFLNGCSTEAQVEKLQAANVPTIIATNAAINDSKALHFAGIFYRTLANADHPTVFNQTVYIQQAFDTGTAYLKSTEANVVIEKTARGLKLKRQKGTDIPWILYTEVPEWTLPTTVYQEIAKKNYQLSRFLLVFVPLLTIGLTYFYYQYRVMHTPIDLTVKLDNQTPNSALPPLTANLTLTYQGKTEVFNDINEEAIFKNQLPSRKDKIVLSFNAVGFESRDTSFLLTQGLVLPIWRDDTYGHVKGMITEDVEQNEFIPIAGVKISLSNITTHTDESGAFELKIPFDEQRLKQRIDFYKTGYRTISKEMSINKNIPVRLTLEKQ